MACHPKEEGHWFWNSIFLEIWNVNRTHFCHKSVYIRLKAPKYTGLIGMNGSMFWLSSFPSTAVSLPPLPFSLPPLPFSLPPFPSLPCCRLSWSMACYQPSLKQCWPSWPPQLKMMTYQTRVYSPSLQSPLQHRYSPKEKGTQWIVPFHCYFIICRFWTS